MLHFLRELVEARSVEEIVRIAQAQPEMVSAELGRMLEASIADATARSDWGLVAALQQVGQVLTAMRNPVGGDSTRKYRIMDLLLATPLRMAFARLGDQHEWIGWAQVLASDPGLYGGECLSFLGRARNLTVPQDAWLADCLMQFLADCHDGQPAAAIQWWCVPTNSGEGSQLPYEFAIACAEFVVEQAKSNPDPAVQHEASRTAGTLGMLLYRRALGHHVENAERAIKLLKSAVDQVVVSGDIHNRANLQQSLANALNRIGGTERHEEALEVTAAALEGWAKDDDPELWGLIMNARGNAFAKLAEDGRTDLIQDAIDCYDAALTALTRERNPRRWAIAMYGLANAHLYRASLGHVDDWDAGLRYLESAAELRTRAEDPFRWAITQHQLGICYLRRASPNRSSDLTRAAGYFSGALEVFSPELYPVEMCKGKISLGRALLAQFELNRQQETLQQARQALTEALVSPVDSDRREAHDLLANVGLHASGRDMGSYEDALSHRYRALDLCDKNEQPGKWAREAAQVGIALVVRPYADYAEDKERGIQYLREALRLLPDDADTELRVRILSFLGLAYSHRVFGERKDNLDQAERYCESALELADAEPGTRTWADAQLILGECLAESDRNLFTEEQEQHRFERALACFDLALQVHDRDSSPAMWADLQRTIGQAYLDRAYGSHGVEAIPSLQAAAMMYRKLGAVTDTAEVNIMLARAFLGRDDRRSARSAMFARRLVPVTVSPYLYGQASQALGYARAAQGKPEEAGLAWRDAVRARRRLLDIAVMPTQRQEVRNGFRANLAEKAALEFARAADQARDDQRRQYLLRTAVETLDEGRAADLAAALGRQDYLLGRIEQSHPELRERYEASLAKVNAGQRTDRAQTTMGFRRPDADFAAEPWLANRAAAQAAWAEFDAVRALIRRRTGRDVTSEPLTVDDLTTLLEPGQVIACLLLDDERCLTLLVRSDGVVEALWSALPTEEFFWLGHWLQNQAAFAVVARLSPDLDPIGKLRAALDATLPEAGRDLVAPLARRLTETGTTSIYLISCGLLSILPVHACPYLSPGGTSATLADEFDVTYLPAMHFLRSSATSTSPTVGKLVAVTNPLPNPRPLPFAGTQSERISAAAASAGVPVEVLAEADGTTSAVLRAVRGARYVDFACHGSIDHMEPLTSGLELAGEQRLTLGDLLDSRILDGVELATLAFCQSAQIMGNVFSDEPLSLAAGFLEAGVRAILGTTWLIDDLATALLVGRFYQNYLVGDPAGPSGPLSPPTALRRAQIWLRELTLADVARLFAANGDREQVPRESLHESIRPFDHPIYWAPFVILGS
jgi:CHAT domain-containing protein/tetratricopeptide (TPR) repeat protein